MTMTATFAQPTRPTRLFARLFGVKRSAPVADRHDHEAARARQDFILDRLNDNAFASEHDVAAMMALHPREF